MDRSALLIHFLFSPSSVYRNRTISTFGSNAVYINLLTLVGLQPTNKGTKLHIHIED